MKRPLLYSHSPLRDGAVGICLGLLVSVTPGALAYETYDGCASCHGDFRGPTSTKGTVFPSNNNHEMHRNTSYMDSECNLCHGSSFTPVMIGSSAGTANNPGLGCNGCHLGAGLRAHHLANGEDVCLDCHDSEPVPPETTKPPYYDTPDTKVKNPANDVLASNTNENWSVGDFLGLDTDGNNLYDLADYAIGPFRLLSVETEGNDLRVRWETAGGRTNTLQAGRSLTGTFADLSPQIVLPGVGVFTTNYLDVGGATNPARFFRLNAMVP